jgi:hypothetical protein
LRKKNSNRFIFAKVILNEAEALVAKKRQKKMGKKWGRGMFKTILPIVIKITRRSFLIVTNILQKKNPFQIETCKSCDRHRRSRHVENSRENLFLVLQTVLLLESAVIWEPIFQPRHHSSISLGKM